MYARVVYYEETNPMGEGYAIEVMLEDDEEWGLDTFYPMVKCEDDPRTAKEFIHFGIIPRLSFIQSLGYEVTIL